MLLGLLLTIAAANGGNVQDDAKFDAEIAGARPSLVEVHFTRFVRCAFLLMFAGCVSLAVLRSLV